MDIPIKPQTTTKHPYTTPNIDYPNLYYKSCDRTYSDRTTYRHHLRFVHKINVLSTKHHPMIHPDINDPSRYCRACEKRFARTHKNGSSNIHLACF
jgi:hypothetical protein